MKRWAAETGEHWSLPEPADPDAGRSALARSQRVDQVRHAEVTTSLPLGDLLGPPEQPEHSPAGRWRLGSAGERSTAQILTPLRRLGWGVLHDRRIPGSAANVDHLVVAPTGVWVIDSKAYRGRIRILGDRLWYGSTCLDDDVLRIAAWTAERVAHALGTSLVASGLEVRPLLCVHGATLHFVPLHWHGVVVTTPPALLGQLAADQSPFPPERLGTLSAVAGAVLPPVIR